MTDQNACELIIILDRSGSMASVRRAMEEGFDGFIAAQQRVPGRCAVTLVQFDTQATETVYEARPVHLVPRLHLEPRGGTPLLDAVASTIRSVGERLRGTAEVLRPGRVLVTIITDGHENSSRRVTLQQVRDMIQHQEAVYKWQFAYLGANVDAFAEAGGMAIPLTAAAGFAQTAQGVSAMFDAHTTSTAAYRSGAAYAISDEQRATMGGTASKISAEQQNTAGDGGA